MPESADQELADAVPLRRLMVFLCVPARLNGNPATSTVSCQEALYLVRTSDVFIKTSVEDLGIRNKDSLQIRRLRLGISVQCIQPFFIQ